MSGGPPSPSHRLKQSAPNLQGVVQPQPVPPSLHLYIQPFVQLLGTFRGPGKGYYPTIPPFTYEEEITLEPVGNKPLLAYRSRTWHPESKQGLHVEQGYIKLLSLNNDGRYATAEFINTQATGIAEISVGTLTIGSSSDATARNIDAVPAGSSTSSSSTSVVAAIADGPAAPATSTSTVITLTLESKSISRTPSSKPPQTEAIQRTIRVTGNTLQYNISMQTDQTPMTPHLEGSLSRLS